MEDNPQEGQDYTEDVSQRKKGMTFFLGGGHFIITLRSEQ